MASTNTVQAMEEAEVITEHLCNNDSENGISPQWNAIQCGQCERAAAFACVRHKAQLYDTVTHGNGCKKMYYRAPSAYYCTWCGWYYDEPMAGAYHYCYIIHTSCGKGTEIMCPCDVVYTPVYGKLNRSISNYR